MAAAYVVAGLSTVGSIALTLMTITKHILQTQQPQLRTYTIRVLLMVPIYAIEAFAGLVLREWSELFEVWRECYEAFTLFSFMQLMMAYLAMEAPGSKPAAIRVALDMRSNPAVPHLWPLHKLPAWQMGPVFLRHTLVGVFQYCAVMLCVTLVSYLAWMLDFYNADSFSWLSAYTWLAIIQSTSQCYALYCLVLFYQASRAQLAPIKPLHKFLCIKMVVFATFWQEVVIACLVRFGVIDAENFANREAMTEAEAVVISPNGVTWTTAQIANGLNDFIVCVEMLVFALIHNHVFPPADYTKAERMGTRMGMRDIPQGQPYQMSQYSQYYDAEDEDPELHITQQRVQGKVPQQKQMIQHFVQGVNFFDLINDVKTMHELQDEETEDKQEAEMLCAGGGYSSFGCSDNMLEL